MLDFNVRYNNVATGALVLTVNHGSTTHAPLGCELIIDDGAIDWGSGSTDDYDALFDVDYTGKIHSPSRHRKMWFVDWGDAQENWDAPENMPAEYFNRSRALGKETQHVYCTPQTATIRVEVWDPQTGQKVFGETTQSVTNPLDDAQHIVLCNPSGDSDFTEITRGDYPGATFYEETLSGSFGAGTELSAYAGLDNVCWLFKRGGTFTLGASHSGVGDYPYFGAYGTSSTVEPFMSVGGTGFTHSKVASPSQNEMRIHGLHLDGGWTTQDTVAVIKNVGANGVIPKESWRTTIADCRLTNFQGQAIRSNATDPGLTSIEVFVANTELHNIGGGEYPTIFGNSANSDKHLLCYVGLKFTDEPNIMAGAAQSSVNTNHRALLRINTATGVHIRSCDFFFQAGGSGQPIMKINKSGRSGAYLSVQFCAGEGPTNFVNFTEDDSGKVSPVQHSIIECCIFLMNPEGQRICTGASNGQTGRGLYAVAGTWTDKTLSQGDTTYRARGIHLPGAGEADPYDTNEPSVCETYSCGALNLRTQAQNAGRLWGGENFALTSSTASFGGVAQVWRYANTYTAGPFQTGGDQFNPHSADTDPATSAGIFRLDGNPMRFRFQGWNDNGSGIDSSYSYNNDIVPSMEFAAASSGIGSSDTGGLVYPLDYRGRVKIKPFDRASFYSAGKQFERDVQTAPA